MLRLAAQNMAGAFTVIYLYQNGFSLAVIGFMWAGLYALKAAVSLPLAAVVAWVGPKHATLISNVLYIPAMILFAILPLYGDWLVFPALAIQGVSTVLYGVAHSVNFSKVKSASRAGNQLAVMNIFEKIVAGGVPMIGGFLSFVWGPQFVLCVAAVLFLLAALPLFKTGEQIQIRRVLSLRGFPWKLYVKQLGGHVPIGFDSASSGFIWSLFVAIFIIGMAGENNTVYAVTGVLLSVVSVIAMISSYVYGRLVDRKRGRALYTTGVFASLFVHAARPFMTTLPAVFILNATREVTATAYTLPYTRACFDTADVSGARVTYLGLVDMAQNIGSCMASIIFAVLVLITQGGATGFAIFFYLTAGVALCMFTARFPLFRKTHFDAIIE